MFHLVTSIYKPVRKHSVQYNYSLYTFYSPNALATYLLGPITKLSPTVIKNEVNALAYRLQTRNHPQDFIQPKLMDLIIRRRNSLFGHVAKLGNDTAAHQALHCQINISLGRLSRTWKRPPQVALETSVWIRFVLTTISHRLIYGDVLISRTVFFCSSVLF